jgi:hypothetical protein
LALLSRIYRRNQYLLKPGATGARFRYATVKRGMPLGPVRVNAGAAT